jgi:signal transduction histidine kinase
VTFAPLSPSGVRLKIICRREARSAGSDKNAVVLARDMEELVAVTRRLLSSFIGRLAVVVALALTAALETRTAAGLNVLAVVPLILAHRWPFIAALGSTLATIAILSAHNAPVTAAGICVLLFLIVQLVTRRGLLFALPLLVPFIVNARTPLDDSNAGLPSASPLVLFLAALVVGEAMRKRGQAVAALDETQEAMAENTRARTVMEERARIARELHDIVAHHLSVIAIESEAARLTSPELSANAGDRLEAIASTAREALTETRRLLGVLRDDTGGKADRTPQPGLDELSDLIDRAQATGTHIRLIREGTSARLPLSIDLAAYRIVQEALTNARRHAPGANVDVEVSYGEQALHLRVRDYGPGAINGKADEGHGLMGMRERATLAGGTFCSGPADGGGFEVDVTLPTTETAP